LLALSPLMLIIAGLIKLGDGGPAFFRQRRIGWHGQPFSIVKFRSMTINAEELGATITKGGDPRVTNIGRWLRKTKLDEFPQLWNVLKGDMSLVGPRPEVPRFVDKYDADQRRILELKPGITDYATLEFRHEEQLLAQALEKNPNPSGNKIDRPGSKSEGPGRSTDLDATEEYYMQFCVPKKIRLSLSYAARATLWTDLVIILRTVFPIWERQRAER